MAADAEPATKTAEPIPSDVKVEDAGPALKRISITVPAQVVDEKLNEQLGTLAGEAVLPGFRKGRAPRRLLERRFGSAVREETRNQLIAETYEKAIEDLGIRPVGDPRPTPPPDEIELEDGKPLSFAVEVEVVPDFELPEVEGIEIRKPMLEITDEHVENRLRRQAHRLGSSAPIEGDFRPGDRLLGNATLRKSGEEEPLFEDEALVVVPGEEQGGRGPVLGLMVDDLAQRLEGRRVGDTITIESEGPAAHEREDLRGAALTITFRITAAQRTEPASLEQLVTIFGTGTEENLREQIRLALQHQRDQEQAGAMREQVYRHIENAVEMELPERLSAAQAARAVEGRRLELLEQGASVEEIEAQLAELRAESEADVRRRLRLFFVLQRLGQQFNVEVTEQEVNARIATLAAQHGERPDQLRAELTRTGRISEVARMIYEQKTADQVIARAKVTEVPVEEWNRDEQTAEKSGAGRKKKKKKRAGK